MASLMSSIQLLKRHRNAMLGDDEKIVEERTRAALREIAQENVAAERFEPEINVADTKKAGTTKA